MDEFSIKTAFKMGEPHEQYGQTWYATVEEMQYPVMFNLMQGSVQAGDKVAYETQEINKFKSGKNMGKEYRRLKKVKVLEGGPREITPESVAKNQSNADLEARVKKLEDTVFATPVDPSLDRIMEVEDEEINLNDIPF